MKLTLDVPAPRADCRISPIRAVSCKAIDGAGRVPPVDALASDFPRGIATRRTRRRSARIPRHLDISLGTPIRYGATGCHALRPPIAPIAPASTEGRDGSDAHFLTSLRPDVVSRASHRQSGRYNVPESDTRRTTMSLTDEIKLTIIECGELPQADLQRLQGSLDAF